MNTGATYRGRSIMKMTQAELRQALAETVGQLEEQERRGLTAEQVGQQRINAAFRRATTP